MKIRIALLGLLLSANAFAQGAPYAINSSLIWAGDPAIGDSPGAPITIDKPGRYYLSEDVATYGQGIIVSTGNFELDLNGFSLIGNGGVCTFSGSPVTAINCPNANSNHGITVSPGYGVSIWNVVIKNGVIRNFTGDGVRCSSRSCSAEDLKVISNHGIGVYMPSGQARRIQALQNGDGGMLTRTASDSFAASNGRYGINSVSISNSTAEDNYSADGYSPMGVTGNQVNAVLVQQGNIGIGASINGQISNSTIQGGSTGLQANAGSAFGNTVQVSGAGSIGISVTSPGVVRQNVVTAAAGATPISGNPVSGQNLCNGASC